jgi:hypothetical protein
MARRTNEILDQWGVARLVLVNLAVLTALLPLASAVRVAAGVVVLAMFVLFVALALRAMATARRRAA